MMTTAELARMSSQVRRDVLRMVYKAGSGHPGGSLSSADILTALYFNVMKQDPRGWTRDTAGQDAFILSAGHLAPVLYSVLARCGYFPVEELSTLRVMGSRLQGHPSVKASLPGIIQPSGSLGQGLSVAAGIALAKRLDGSPCRSYVLCGDGESEEGQIWEAAMFAQFNKLDNLIAITDWNGKQIDGPVEQVAGLGDLAAKWESFGWETIVADGHDFDAILAAFAKADNSNGKPKMLLFRTEMGHGVDFMAGKHEWHGKVPAADLLDQALAQIPQTIGDF